MPAREIPKPFSLKHPPAHPKPDPRVEDAAPESTAKALETPASASVQIEAAPASQEPKSVT